MDEISAAPIPSSLHIQRTSNSENKQNQRISDTQTMNQIVLIDYRYGAGYYALHGEVTHPGEILAHALSQSGMQRPKVMVFRAERLWT